MKPDLTNAVLYGILDLSYIARSQISRVAGEMIDGGVDVIQLRAKEESLDTLTLIAERLHEITSRSSVPLIVNDYPAIAAEIPAEGVHLGQNDDSIVTVREKAGREMIVGKSTHSVEQAIAAQAEHADYIGFGPIFATPTKPDYKPIGLNNIQLAHEKVKLPIFCIGGIKLDNLEQVIAAGAQRVAIVSGLLQAPDIAKYAREAKRILQSSLTSSSFVLRPSSF